MIAESILIVWTATGLGWWLVALYLARNRRDKGVVPDEPLDERRITVFKPLARLGHGELGRLRAGLESFVATLDRNSEMIVGCHQADEAVVRPFVEELRSRHPSADLKLVVHADPNHLPNPKVAWIRILSTHATGELWLWSDADMEAPRHALRSLRADLARTGAAFVTSPYVVQRAEGSAELLDALFVNVEFYPGAVLLGRLDLIRFGFGSGMLFEAEHFARVVDWETLGGCLAEDYHLGRMLAPASLGSTRFVTSSASETWRGALLHYLRWQKTIRWCRPGPYAAQLVVLPILGWLVYVLLGPTRPFGWLGLLAVLLADGIAAVSICRAVGCWIPWSRTAALPLWSLARGLSWVACWLPWPIVWRGRKWWSPFKLTGSSERDRKVLDTEGQVSLE